VVAKALAKSPEDRYRTCGELMAAAHSAITQQTRARLPAQGPAPPTVFIQGPAHATFAAPAATSASSPRRSASAAYGVPPDEHHYEAVSRYMIDQGTVVPLLGPRVTGTLPDAGKIAAD